MEQTVESLLTHEEMVTKFCNTLENIGHSMPKEVVLMIDSKKNFFMCEGKLCLAKKKNKMKFKEVLIGGLLLFCGIKEKEDIHVWDGIFNYHFNKHKKSWIK